MEIAYVYVTNNLFYPKILQIIILEYTKYIVLKSFQSLMEVKEDSSK